MAYATQTDFESYVEGWVTDNADALAVLLESASRDVDRVLEISNTDRDQTTGYKLDPATLATWQAAALSRAVCAQAEYRERMGEDFFIEAARNQQLGPKALSELRDAGFAVRFGLRSVSVVSSSAISAAANDENV